MKANEFFTQEWGTGFIKATLSEKNGLLEMSMEDIYSTMEKYAELCLSNVVGRSEQLPCEHEYKAIYLGMGYVRQCQKCGDIQQ